MTLEFLVITFVIVVTPGIGVLYTLSAALTRGVRAALIAALGCTLGILPHAVGAILGLAAVIYASSLAFQVLRYFGVAYLVYLALTMLRERAALTMKADRVDHSALQVIGRAIAINLLNPKLSLFFFAFLPQFVSPREPGATTHMLLLSGVFMAVTLAVFAMYGLLAAYVRRRLISQSRLMTWLRRMFAVAFLGMAARLAVSER